MMSEMAASVEMMKRVLKHYLCFSYFSLINIVGVRRSGLLCRIKTKMPAGTNDLPLAMSAFHAKIPT